MPVGEVARGAVIPLLEQTVYVGRGHIIGSPSDRGHQPTPVRAVEESLGGAVAHNLGRLVVARPGDLPAHVAALGQQIAVGIVAEGTGGPRGSCQARDRVRMVRVILDFLCQPHYSTVTDLARLRGLSTSVPRVSALW